MNSYLLPAGAVVVCLGWRQDESAIRIQYFDSHLLHSLEHVRAIFYPRYDEDELVDVRVASTDRATGHRKAAAAAAAGSVTKAVKLNIVKAKQHVLSAVGLQTRGFKMPVDPTDNANVYDRAFEALVERTGQVSRYFVPCSSIDSKTPPALPPPPYLCCAYGTNVGRTIWH